MDTHETSVYTAILITGVTLGIILLFFITTMLLQHRRNISLYKAKVRAEVTTLEKERSRIAADLHDDLGPLLAAVKFKISSIDTSAEDAVLLEEANQRLDTIIERVREISNDLVPGTLQRKGVFHAIEEFVGSISGTTPLKISFHHDGKVELSSEQAVNIFRMVQEIVHNTLKHAKAGTLHIEIRSSPQLLVLETTDDGIGYDNAGRHGQQQGRGLLNLQNRTEMMGGSLHTETAPGKGTRYLVELPLQNSTT